MRDRLYFYDAVNRLNARPLEDGDYIHYADETDSYYRITKSELVMLGEMLQDDPVDTAYSEWCATCGEECDEDGEPLE